MRAQENTRGTNAEWVMVLPPRTCDVPIGVLKRDKQSTVHTNLITVDGLWDMDRENSIYIEKYGEVKGTPHGKNGSPMMVCETYQRVVFTGKKGTDRTTNVTAGCLWTCVCGGAVYRTHTEHRGGALRCALSVAKKPSSDRLHRLSGWPCLLTSTA